MYQGSTDAEIFECFIETLLPYCGKWPEPKSVLVMDNASFHHLERIQQMCDDAGVVLLYLLPYSPDLNPIEEFFEQGRRLGSIHHRDGSRKVRVSYTLARLAWIPRYFLPQSTP